VKRVGPLLVTYVIGASMLFEFFFKVPVVNKLGEMIRSWIPIITAFLLLVGTVNLILIHIKNIQRKISGWYKSVLLILAFCITVAVGLSMGQESQVYDFIFTNVLNAAGSTMFALTAFYIGSSSFRAFRATNLYAAILLVAGGVVMLARVPVGEYISPAMPYIGQWIMDFPNVAGQRGIMIAMGIGFVAQCLRIILGYSRRHLGVGE